MSVNSPKRMTTSAQIKTDQASEQVHGQVTGKERDMTLQRDLALQQNVLDELLWDPSVLPNEIGVVVKDGVVILTGWVESYAKRVAAETAAARVRGVHAIANEIEVHLPGMAERLDSDIAAAALHALTWDAAIPSGEIDLTVTNGRVTLKGQVAWEYQRREAERVVQRLAGVREVNNHLVVKPHPVPGDLMTSITRALERQAQLQAHLDVQGITVETHGSTVTLRGRVHSFAEKETAEATVWAAPGVTQVNNYLVVAV